jgi:hypothetical protein
MLLLGPRAGVGSNGYSSHNVRRYLLGKEPSTSKRQSWADNFSPMRFTVSGIYNTFAPYGLVLGLGSQDINKSRKPVN